MVFNVPILRVQMTKYLDFGLSCDTKATSMPNFYNMECREIFQEVLLLMRNFLGQIAGI